MNREWLGGIVFIAAIMVIIGVVYWVMTPRGVKSLPQQRVEKK